MRRLPVYLLVDTSGSMYGEAIESVRNGLQVLVSALRQDPYALETAYLSIITFDSSARQITPLTELMSFQMPKINANGATAMGEALSLLADCINREVIKGSADVKGDWKPVVFLFIRWRPHRQHRQRHCRFKNSQNRYVCGMCSRHISRYRHLEKNHRNRGVIRYGRCQFN